MTVSQRLEALKELTALLEMITPANGFDHNLEGAVFRGRMTYGVSDPMPMVSILESPNPKPFLNGEGGCVTSGDWELIIQGFVDDDHASPTDNAYILLEEVKMKLRETKSVDRGTNILGRGGKVSDLNIGGGVVRPPDEASQKAYFWLVVTLKIVE